MRRLLINQKKKENLIIGEFSNTAAITYLATSSITLKPTKKFVIGKTYRVKFTLNYSVRANNTTTPAEVSINMGAINNYLVVYAKVTNASTAEDIAATMDFDYIFTSKLNVDDSSAAFQKTIIVAKYGYKNGTVAISNASIMEV